MQGKEEGGSGPAGSSNAPLREKGTERPPPGQPGAVTTSRERVSQDRPAEGFVEGPVELWSGGVGGRRGSRCPPNVEAGAGGAGVRGVQLRASFRSLRPCGGKEGSEEVLWHRVCL